MKANLRGRGDSRGSRPGLFFRHGCVALALTLTLAGCSRDGAPPRDVVELESGQVQLPEGARRHDVALEGVGAATEIEPSIVEASAGDAVAFTAEDAVTHSVVFVRERMDSAQVAFLDSTGQLRSPPLLSTGSSWIVSLADAPPGNYPFVCPLHGGEGVIRLAAPR